MNIQEETQLTLALPGSTKSTTPVTATKRAFSTTTLDLHLGTKHVVGWPPVRGNRKNIGIKSCKYVKVAVDGAPYLRKVDLEVYDGYENLLRAVDSMFVGTNLMSEKKFMLTYEDKDGDWMLLGDVPWKMFVESCKRIRLMISMEDSTSCSSRCTGSREKNN
ncbi:auxin-responsive protein IAA23-like [Vicia villosa]|uniref:auxin-responsive protein IAA23-like n=1 Tax=Vicia villosa TaxID=3911 RepID=UPI00273B44B7|nr:auxin-responsive protein IAA23-like [Vicia villosa]